ncbi:flagellar motor switch protein FliM [Bacillus sp. B15-48]|uniref:flagellar motor switch protein FliM n=1 Tax=Bacillus sp. B15-48 TaxID=1548601 RepID=UPI0019400174|nr:flagellar motor switch protein FliM [Bacillus sp. B15-48]MBM4764130.1 flagellar motor switch protein FliM [Bacillus sp. B15-48]
MMTDTIAARNDGSSGSAQVRAYDFKKALRLSVEQVRVLTKIHENFAYQFSSTISAQLRSIVQVEVVRVEQILYEEFVKELPSNTILGVFGAGAQEMRMVMDFNPKMTYAMMDRLLGGRGTADGWDRLTLTPIETNVLRKLMEGVSQNLSKAWADIMPLQLRVLEMETNPQFLQLAVPTETVINIVFNVTLGKDVERMHLCIPYLLLEPYIPKLSSHIWYANARAGKRNDGNDNIQEKIEHLTVPISAELGRATISIEEFLGLAVGDVIQLDQLVEEPLSVKINDQTKFLAYPGTKKSRMAVKIEKVLEGEESNE